MYTFKNIDHQKVLVCLLTLLVNVVSAANKVPPFIRYRLHHDCKNQQLSVDENDCDVQIDYDLEESKLSGKCEFYVESESECCSKEYGYKVHVDFEDSDAKTIFNASSYPCYIKSSARQKVSFMVQRQFWERERMIANFYPRIEIIEHKRICLKRLCCSFLCVVLIVVVIIVVHSLVHSHEEKYKDQFYNQHNLTMYSFEKPKEYIVRPQHRMGNSSLEG